MSASWSVVSSILVGFMLTAWVVRYGRQLRDKVSGVIGIAAIFVITALIGLSGIVADFSKFPPPFAAFFAALIILACTITLSPWGNRMTASTPLRILIAMQGFRILPEILLDLAWRDGLAPIQMTFHGRNFDIVTALVAIGLAMVWPRLGNPKVWAVGFSVLGVGLLINIVGIAFLSAPTPLRVFFEDPANTFVTTFPYIWLPGIHVLTAIVLHGMLIRKIIGNKSSA